VKCIKCGYVGNEYWPMKVFYNAYTDKLDLTCPRCGYVWSVITEEKKVIPAKDNPWWKFW
jgi:uncharacterized Zn finger protein